MGCSPYILLLTLNYVPGSGFLYQDMVFLIAGDPEINPQLFDLTSTASYLPCFFHTRT